MPKNKEKEIEMMSEEDIEKISGGIIACMSKENKNKIEIYDDKGKYLFSCSSNKVFFIPEACFKAFKLLTRDMLDSLRGK